MPTATVTGLQGGTSYDFQVYGYNTVGNGNPTTPITVVTTGAPPAPPPAPPPPAPPGIVQWESFSLIWDPPAYKPVQWFEAGAFAAEAGSDGVGSVPTAYQLSARTDAASDTQGDLKAPMRWTAGAKADAASAIGSGILQIRRPAGAQADATANTQSRTAVRSAVGAQTGATTGVNGGALKSGLVVGAQAAASIGVRSDALAVSPSGTAWTVAAQRDAIAGVKSDALIRNFFLASTLGANATTQGNAVARQFLLAGQVDATTSVKADGISGHNWTVAGKTDAAVSVQSNAIIRNFFLSATLGASTGTRGDAVKGAAGVSYPVVGQLLPTATVIPFGGNAPLRVSNYITNPGAYGAVNGSPGTMPTNWDAWSDDLTRTVVGTGTESQIPYIDLRFNKAAAAGGQVGIQLDNGLPFGAGSTWSLGVFLRLTAGSWANVASVQLELATFSGAGANFLNQYLSDPVTPTSSGLATQWFVFNGVLLNDSGMDTIGTNVLILYNAGAVNFTIRIGQPRFERQSTVHGSQYIVVPKAAFLPNPGDATNYVY